MSASPPNQKSPYLPASTPRSADMVLYLDLDGVLHHEAVLWHPRKGIFMSPYEAAGHTLFEWAHFLESALEPYPAAALVLSSTWCIRPGYSATLKRLPPSLCSRFIGGRTTSGCMALIPGTCPCFGPCPGDNRFWKMPREDCRANGLHWMMTWKTGPSQRVRT